MEVNLTPAKVAQQVEHSQAEIVQLQRRIDGLLAVWGRKSTATLPAQVATSARFAGVSDAVIAEHEQALDGWLTQARNVLGDMREQLKFVHNDLGSAAHVVEALRAKGRARQ